MSLPNVHSALLAQEVEVRNQGLNNVVPEFLLMSQAYGSPAYTMKQISARTPGAIPDFTSGDTDAFTMGVGPSQTITPQGKGLQVTIQRGDYERDANAVRRQLDGLQNAAIKTINTAAYTLFNDLKTGTYSDGTGTPKFISDGSPDHTIADGSTTWNNRVSASFDEAAWESALVKLGAQLHFADGVKMEFDKDPLTVVCHTAKRNAVAKILRNATIPFDVAGGNNGVVDNPNALNNNIILLHSSLMANQNDVFVVSRERAPLTTWIPIPIKLMMDDNVASQSITVSVTFEFKVSCQVPPYGLVGIIA